MKFRIEVIWVSENGTEERSKVTAIERQELAMETLGLNLAEGKSILEGLRTLLLHSRRPRILNSGEPARAAVEHIPAKAQERLM